jgi:hypothetical protein
MKGGYFGGMCEKDVNFCYILMLFDLAFHLFVSWNEGNKSVI